MAAYAALQLSSQFHADHTWHKRRDGLPESRSFSLNAANAPTQDADAVGGRRVRISTDKRVKVCKRTIFAFTPHHDACKVLDIQLMADARTRRHNAHIVVTLEGFG